MSVDDPSSQERTEGLEKVEKHCSVSDVHKLVQTLSGLEVSTLPNALQMRIRNDLTSWVDMNQLEGGTNLKSMVEAAKWAINKANNEEGVFLYSEKHLPSDNLIRLRRGIISHPPMEFPIVGEYSTDELESNFPKGLELKRKYGEDVRILVYQELKRYYILESPDGKKRTLRIITTDRSLEQINADLNRQPKGLPSLEAFGFQDGQVGILADWIEGREANLKDGEDKDLCADAASTFYSVPNEADGNPGYDLNYTNFIIRDEAGGERRAYYVDSDVPELIFKQGLLPEIDEQQRLKFREKIHSII